MKATELEIRHPTDLGLAAVALMVGTPVTSNLVPVAGWSYHAFFLRLDHIGGTTDLSGIKVVIRGFTTGIIVAGANVYGKATLIDIRSLRTWFAGPDGNNWVNYTNNDQILQVCWSKTGTETVTMHGGDARLVQGRSWQTVQFTLTGIGAAGAGSTVSAFVQGY